MCLGTWGFTGEGLNLDVLPGGFFDGGEVLMAQVLCPGHTPNDRKGGTICPRCGGLMPSEDVTEMLLETLAQLAQFGLDAEGRPLLDRRAEDRS
jgi:hypothetical protein